MTIEERYNYIKNRKNRYTTKANAEDRYIRYKVEQQEQEQLEAEISKIVEQAIDNVLKDFE